MTSARWPGSTARIEARPEKRRDQGLIEQVRIPSTPPAARTTSPALVLHGGAGSADAHSAVCAAAGQAPFAALAAGGDPLDAAVAATAALEDSGCFNAGAGSSLRMDGRTIEMDAGVMDTHGRLGAVAALRDAPNPVRVARGVADTPHWLLAGDGARRFAGRLGLLAPFAPGARARERYRRSLQRLVRSPADAVRPYEDFWNFETPWQQVLDAVGTGTVGAVARSVDGHFAVATSTGGSMPQLLGRVGDTPVAGCGYYAGVAGAVAATGVGEHIVGTLLAVTVYRWIEQGTALGEALERGLSLIPPHVDVGLIGVTGTEACARARTSMASAILGG